MSRRPRSFYERRIFPWVNDRCSRSPEIERLRGEALSAARGRVLEIGFGGGANLPYYPPAVDRIVAVDPNDGMHDLAAPRIRAFRVPVHAVVAEAEALPLADGSVDTAVSTLTLCSVSDPARALGELRRVLADYGQIILLEHGLSTEPGVARWQHRLNRLQNLIACGCNLNRPIAYLVGQSGLGWEQVRQFYAAGIPRTHGWITMGRAWPVESRLRASPSMVIHDGLPSVSTGDADYDGMAYVYCVDVKSRYVLSLTRRPEDELVEVMVLDQVNHRTRDVTVTLTRESLRVVVSPEVAEQLDGYTEYVVPFDLSEDEWRELDEALTVLFEGGHRGRYERHP